MKLPNKIITFNESDFKNSIYILNELTNKRMQPVELYKKTKKHFNSIGEFIDVLDFLYLLNTINYCDKGGELFVI